MRDKSIPIVYSTMVFVLSACATAANGGSGERVDDPRGVARYESDPRLGEEVRSMCFASSVNSFKENTDDTVVLEISPSKNYLVETSSCFNLDSAQSVGLDVSTGCARKGDYLIVSDSAFGLQKSSGIGPGRCVIKGIYEWNEDGVAESITSETP